MDRPLTPQAARLLDAACTCIARVGVAKTTLDDVAREAGCSRATLYRYFPGKQQLLGALVAREAASLRRQLLAARNGRRRSRSFGKCRGCVHDRSHAASRQL